MTPKVWTFILNMWHGITMLDASVLYRSSAAIICEGWGNVGAASSFGDNSMSTVIHEPRTPSVSPFGDNIYSPHEFRVLFSPSMTPTCRKWCCKCDHVMRFKPELIHLAPDQENTLCTRGHYRHLASQPQNVSLACERAYNGNFASSALRASPFTTSSRALHPRYTAL